MQLSQLNKGTLILLHRRGENSHAIITSAREPMEKRRYLDVIYENKPFKATVWTTAFDEIVIRIIFDKHNDAIFQIKATIQYKGE